MSSTSALEPVTAWIDTQGRTAGNCVSRVDVSYTDTSGKGSELLASLQQHTLDTYQQSASHLQLAEFVDYFIENGQEIVKSSDLGYVLTAINVQGNQTSAAGIPSRSIIFDAVTEDIDNGEAGA